tara:strand:- start:244 stop:450 length:207 start_codon:yes stop_codon:yes gene_type:complete
MNRGTFILFFLYKLLLFVFFAFFDSITILGLTGVEYVVYDPAQVVNMEIMDDCLYTMDVHGHYDYYKE